MSSIVRREHHPPRSFVGFICWLGFMAAVVAETNYERRLQALRHQLGILAGRDAHLGRRTGRLAVDFFPGLLLLASPQRKRERAPEFPSYNRRMSKTAIATTKPCRHRTLFQGVRSGNFIFTAGQAGIDPATQQVVAGASPSKQPALRELEGILKPAARALAMWSRLMSI